MRELLRNRVNWPALAALTVALLSALAVLSYYETPPWAALWYLAVFAFTVTGPGTLLWRALTAVREGAFLELAFGTGVGILLQLLFWFCFVGLGIGPWILLGPTIVYLIFAAVPRLHRHWLATRSTERLPAGIAFGLATVFAGCLVLYSRAFALALPPAANSWNQDMYWHLGNAAAMLNGVTPIDLRVAHQNLSYHWFSSAHIAGQTLATGLDLNLVVARLWMVPILAAVLALAVAVGKRLTGSWWPGLVIAAMLGAAASLDLLGIPLQAGSAIQEFSGSQTYAVTVMLLILGLLTKLWQRHRLTLGEWIVLATAMLAAPGAKSSLMPTLICGLALGLLVALIRRRGRLEMALTLGLAVLATAVMMPFVGDGGAGVRIQLLASLRRTEFYISALGLSDADRLFARDPLLPGLTTPLGLITAAVLLLAYAVAYAWLLLGVPALRRSAGHDGGWVLLGTGVAGFCAMMLVDQDGGSQLFFFRMGLVAWYALAAWGLHRLWASRTAERRPRIILAIGIATGAIIAFGGRALLQGLITPEEPLRSLLILLLLVVVIPLVCLLGVRLFLRSTEARSSLLRVVATALAVASLVATIPQSGLPGLAAIPRPPAWAVTTQEFAAADWLRQHSDPREIVATNTHCWYAIASPPCVARSFWVSGFTQRPVLLEGWAYTREAHEAHGVNGLGHSEQPFHDQQLFALNESAFRNPDAETLDRMYRNGVRWLFADRHRSPVSAALDDLADPVFTNDQVTVYRLHR